MLLFRSEEHVARWCAGWNQPRGETFPLPRAWELALWFFGRDRRRVEWRPPTAAESNAELAALGFESPFWRL